MTIWKPELEPGPVPRYQAIADAIANDVDRGVLPAGTRLPTHRDLAKHLGVTVGTITRGYAEAERRGLTLGEVGRGTFVRDTAGEENHGWGRGAPEEGSRLIDMSLSTPWVSPDGADGRILAETLREVADTADLSDLLRYHPDSASLRHRSMAAAWLARAGIDVPPEQIILTSGGQHAMSVILSTFLRPGDTLLTAELTYPGTKALAQTFGLRIRGIELDDEGIVPEALDRACSEAPAQALYCVPTLQNPTCATMSAERRMAIADVARRHGLIILEDEVHAAVDGNNIPPIATFAPERTLYLATLSKTVTFGLRIGFVAAPANAVERVRAGVRSTVWMPAPLMAEIATRWISDGTAEKMGKRQRKELAARYKLAERILGSKYEIRADPRAIHVWLTLPEPWRSDEFVAMVKQRGVLIAGAEAFAVGRRNVPHAVRISLASVPHRAQVEKALEIIADLLEGCCEPCVDIL